MELMLGADAPARLRHARVAIFGLGGVGGYVAEGLARCGVGTLGLIDRDLISLSNINRQILALDSTLGRPKAEVAAERIRDIDPSITTRVHMLFYTRETADAFDLTEYDYIVDAVDTVTAKLELITRAFHAGIPIISSMGTGNKLDPTALRVMDIYDTSFDPLARIMRKELRRRGIPRLKVVCSAEEALRPRGSAPAPNDTGRRDTPGSVSFVPSVAGLIIAGEVARDIMGL